MTMNSGQRNYFLKYIIKWRDTSSQMGPWCVYWVCV